MEQRLFVQISQLVHNSTGIQIPNSKLSQNFRIDRAGEKSKEITKEISKEITSLTQTLYKWGNQDPETRERA